MESIMLFILKITRGKLHGSLDVGLAVMSINKKSNRIDLDAGDILYHMKVCPVPFTYFSLLAKFTT